ncbi:MAG TPA: CvpA family protein [Chitinophagaceae bacterium]
MIIDIIFIILVILAAIKGFRRGLVVGVFSFIAIIVGLAAAIKLSIVVAGYIGSAVKVSDRWLPVVSFLVVFIVVVLLIRLGAKAIEKAVEVIALGWINRLGGILLYLAIYLFVYSVFLFYAEQLNILTTKTIENSATYPYLQPWGPKIIDAIGSVLPFFKGMFHELEQFFAGVARAIPPEQH